MIVASNDFAHPRVGIGVVVFKGSQVLLGKRLSSHGNGEYAGTGGHLEHGETIADCAIRETREEAGIEIYDVRLLCVVNVRTYLPKHYLDVGVTARWASGEPQAREPHKLERWDWYDLTNMPSPLFSMWPKYLVALRTGQNLFEVD